MLVITSKVVSRERKDAKVYLASWVVTWMALGITNAVMRFSRRVIELNAIVSCENECYDAVGERSMEDLHW